MGYALLIQPPLAGGGLIQLLDPLSHACPHCGVSLKARYIPSRDFGLKMGRPRYMCPDCHAPICSNPYPKSGWQQLFSIAPVLLGLGLGASIGSAYATGYINLATVAILAIIGLITVKLIARIAIGRDGAAPSDWPAYISDGG